MNERATELFVSFLDYMATFAKDPEAFSRSGLLKPPENTMDEIAAEEWRRVAPRLYEIDRLWPRETLGLHAYCVAFSHWLTLSRKAETLPELRPYVEEEFAHLKQMARSFGFFLDSTGRMNLKQPLPLELKKKTHRRR
jgi:hypothetical protein